MTELEKPYLIETKILTTRVYNEQYGDYRECKCGHDYERHFDSYMEMDPCGCKYCACDDFKENMETTPSILQELDYNPGLLNPHGGGNAEWWMNYMRREINKCNTYWRDLIESYAEEFKQH
jgi:hypothetical protein